MKILDTKPAKKQYDFIVLGATGIQGRIVTRDLLESGYSVMLAGRNKKRVDEILNHYEKTEFEHVDVKDAKLTEKIIKESGANIVVNCVESNWNNHIIKVCLKAGVHYVDLGSDFAMTIEQLKLNDEIKKKGLTYIISSGSVPGIGNVMLQYAAKKLNTIETIELGFAWSSNIKKFIVPFSMQAIINEMLEPAQVLEDGEFKTIIPKDTTKRIRRRYVGRQVEFMVTHPETYTFYNYFKDKGLRNIRFYAGFPAHSYDKINMMIELGFAGTKPIKVNDDNVKPVDLMNEVLKDIKIPVNYKEKENLWIKVDGKKGKKRKTIIMQCLAHTLEGWVEAGCNVDTGMPASIMAQMIKKGIIKERGIYSPEVNVPPEEFFLELADRKMIVLENKKRIN